MQSERSSLLDPLSKLPLLEAVSFANNRVSDIATLGACQNIHRLGLGNNPINDFSTLSRLPNLTKLEVSGDQVPKMESVGKLANLRKLEIGGKLDSLMPLPDMPALRVLNIRDGALTSLSGIERFPKLCNLEADRNNNLGDIAPISSCRQLTHLRLSKMEACELAPLAELHALRSLFAGRCGIRDISPLYRLPALHEVWLSDNPVLEEEVERLKNELSPWTIEFQAENPMETTLELRTISPEEFDFRDKNPFNVEDYDWNEELFYNEADWVMRQIRDELGIDFNIDALHGDFYIPTAHPIRRSDTIMLVTEASVQKLPLVLRAVQRGLSRARREWVMYVGSDSSEVDVDFALWVYADRVEVQAKDRKIVEQLLAG